MESPGTGRRGKKKVAAKIRVRKFRVTRKIRQGRWRQPFGEVVKEGEGGRS